MAEISEIIKRLISFMSTLQYEKNRCKQKYLLEVQLECMNSYDKCLMTRIKLLIDDMKEREYYGLD